MVDRLMLPIKKFIVLLIFSVLIGISLPTHVASSTNNLDQTDATDPTLNILSPTLGETFMSNKMRITVEARDETAWANFRIQLGQIVLFDLDNVGDTLSSQDLVYTNDFIFLDRLFILGDQPPLLDNILSIRVTDSSNNFQRETIEVGVDLEKPVVTIISPTDDSTTTDTSALVEWIIDDESEISYQEILLNGVPIEPTIETSESIFSFSILLNEPVLETTRYTVTITVGDVEGNTGSNSTTVIFVPIVETSGDSVFDFETLAVLLGTLIGFLIIVFFVVRGGKEKVDKSLHKNWEGELVPPPLLELMEIQLKEDPSSVLQLTHTFSRIEDTWNETATEMLEKGEITNLDMSDFIDTFKSNLMMELFNETQFTPDQFQIMEKKLAEWKSELMVKPKQWKGKLEVPPLESLVDKYPTDKFNDYSEFVKTVGVLLNSWTEASDRITEIEKPTLNQVKGILNDYESETIILLAKTQEFTKVEINEIEKDLLDWMHKLL